MYRDSPYILLIGPGGLFYSAVAIRRRRKELEMRREMYSWFCMPHPQDY